MNVKDKETGRYIRCIKTSPRKTKENPTRWEKYDDKTIIYGIDDKETVIEMYIPKRNNPKFIYFKLEDTWYKTPTNTMTNQNTVTANQE